MTDHGKFPACKTVPGIPQTLLPPGSRGELAELQAAGHCGAACCSHPMMYSEGQHEYNVLPCTKAEDSAESVLCTAPGMHKARSSSHESLVMTFILVLIITCSCESVISRIA